MYVRGNPLRFNDPSGHCPAPSIPGGTTKENQAAWRESTQCTALVETILNAWDKTDYWSQKWPDKEVFKKDLGYSPLTDYDFFLPYWKDYHLIFDQIEVDPIQNRHNTFK